MSREVHRDQIARLLSEFGSAIRGDWGGIDGRSIQGDMDNFASWVRNPESLPDIKTCRGWMGICPHGEGHWDDYCDDTCAKGEEA